MLIPDNLIWLNQKYASMDPIEAFSFLVRSDIEYFKP